MLPWVLFATKLIYLLFHSSFSACNDARIVFLLLTSQIPYLTKCLCTCRCGNVAAILELDENLNKQFRVFEAAPHVCILHLCTSHSSIEHLIL